MSRQGALGNSCLFTSSPFSLSPFTWICFFKRQPSLIISTFGCIFPFLFLVLIFSLSVKFTAEFPNGLQAVRRTERHPDSCKDGGGGAGMHSKLTLSFVFWLAYTCARMCLCTPGLRFFFFFLLVVCWMTSCLNLLWGSRAKPFFPPWFCRAAPARPSAARPQFNLGRFQLEYS